MPTRKPDGSRLNGSGSKWITRERRLAIYLRDRFSCAYCGRSLRDAPAREVTLDHLRPLSAGGTHQSENLVTACSRCNGTRQDTPLARFAARPVRARIAQCTARDVHIDLAKRVLAGSLSLGRAQRLAV